MPLPPSLEARLARLASDQRAAATAPPGPVLCVAPAGSGKTTTLVARIAWLVATGADPARITALTFNRRAAVELAQRLEGALDWLGPSDGGAVGEGSSTRRAPGDERPVRVRTFHALGLEILRSTGRPLPTLLDRATLLRRLEPTADRARLARLDTAFSQLKLVLDVDARDVAADPEAGPIARAYVAYEAALAEAGGMDFDDLVRSALRALEQDPGLLQRWRHRCDHLLVDETQDVDRSQLRLALMLAAPANRIFLVGDDDQSIYGWRLADVRRVLGLARDLPGLRRVDLEVNYRCPAVVVERAVRLVAHNRERFTKAIRAGPEAPGRVVLAPEPGDDEARAGRVLHHLSVLPGSRAILARTNRELLPAAAVALARGHPFHAPGLRLLVDDDRLLDLLAGLRSQPETATPLLVRIGRLRDGIEGGGPPEGERRAAVTDRQSVGAVAADDVHCWASADSASSPAATNDDTPTVAELVAALLGWAVRSPNLDALEAGIRSARERLANLRRDDAPLSLATVHATKGLEFDHVAVVGLDDGRFPSGRAIAEAAEPGRALEEERRLAYVAWTRARHTLILVYDPDSPSRFLLEAFDPAELGIAASSEQIESAPPSLR